MQPRASVRKLVLFVLVLHSSTVPASARIYGNVGNLGTEKLQWESMRASSAFLEGSSALWQMFGFVEVKEFAKARESGQLAVARFQKAGQLFSVAAQSVDHQTGQLLRLADSANAANLVQASPDGPTLKQITAMATQGKAASMVDFCGKRATDLAARTETVIGSLQAETLDRDGSKLLHELIHDWGIAITQGEYISALFYVASHAKR
ncbi:MAG: hypothetical protein HY508_12970 [Acidobacteria bacterium]|nr:hypothetical protein [Acidobacteriota bacterium]